MGKGLCQNFYLTQPFLHCNSPIKELPFVSTDNSMLDTFYNAIVL
ncbi:hypothetical protein PORCAN_1636 [Porphyromonas crevioricanis JCM 13913]|nr:hypothetical protein PORCAN_1636 [Porphyromonas crevioricanis JCM 13913]